MSGFDLIIVPDGDDDEAALILVEALVADRPYRFLLDTGAGQTCIQRDDFTAGFPGGNAPRSSGLFGAAAEGDLITIPRVSLGPISKTELQVVRGPDVGPYHGNLIGMDLLFDRRCFFRFEDQRVDIDLLMKLDPTVVQPLALNDKHHPSIEVELGNTITWAVWDTGAGMTVVDLNVIDRHPDIFHPAGTSHGTDATGATQETAMYRMTGAILGGHVFPPHTVAAVDFAPVNMRLTEPLEIILGYSTSRHANWWFNFPNRHWAITKLLTDQ